MIKRVLEVSPTPLALFVCPMSEMGQSRCFYDIRAASALHLKAEIYCCAALYASTRSR